MEARGWDQFFEAVEIELPEVVIAEGRIIDLWGLEEAQSWANFAAVYWHGPIDPESEESKMFATWFGSLIVQCMTTESQCRYEDAEGNKYIRAPGIDEPFAITQTSLRHWLWMVVLTHDRKDADALLASLPASMRDEAFEKVTNPSESQREGLRMLKDSPHSRRS